MECSSSASRPDVTITRDRATPLSIAKLEEFLPVHVRHLEVDDHEVDRRIDPGEGVQRRDVRVSTATPSPYLSVRVSRNMAQAASESSTITIRFARGFSRR